MSQRTRKLLTHHRRNRLLFAPFFEKNQHVSEIFVDGTHQEGRGGATALVIKVVAVGSHNLYCGRSERKRETTVQCDYWHQQRGLCSDGCINLGDGGRLFIGRASNSANSVRFSTIVGHTSPPTTTTTTPSRPRYCCCCYFSFGVSQKKQYY